MSEHPEHTRGYVIKSFGPGARARMVAHLRRLADAMEAGSEIVDGGLIAHGPLTLSGTITLSEPPAKPMSDSFDEELFALARNDDYMGIYNVICQRKGKQP